MNYYNKDTVIYLNGSLVKAAEAPMDLYSQSLHYGYAVFEGIRSYRTASGETKIFKEQEHYDRLKRSATHLNMPYPWSTEELIRITYEVLEKNGIQDAYIRPLIFAPSNMKFSEPTESYILIAAWPMDKFLGEELLRVMTSPFQRPNPKGFIIEAKATGHYVNSILASQDAKRKGFDEALLTDISGYVAEGPGANMFFEKDGKLFTPATGNILPGITRQTVLELCQQLGIEVEEGAYSIEDVKEADAAFFCGTAAEVIGWQSLDDTVFTIPWGETASRRIQLAYQDLVAENFSTPSARQHERAAVAG